MLRSPAARRPSGNSTQSEIEHDVEQGNPIRYPFLPRTGQKWVDTDGHEHEIVSVSATDVELPDGDFWPLADFLDQFDIMES